MPRSPLLEDLKELAWAIFVLDGVAAANLLLIAVLRLRDRARGRPDFRNGPG